MMSPKIPLTLLLAFMFMCASAQATQPQTEAQPQTSEQVQQERLESLLQILQDNPRYIAAQASVDAAEAQLSAAYNPASLEVRGDYNTTDTNPAATPDAEPLQAQQDDGAAQPLVAPNASQFSADATFVPVPFGDKRDLVKQQELALESVVLDFREAVTRLENQALEAALQFQLAQQSVTLAENTLEVVRAALEASQERFNRGAANERERRDAEANFQQAQTFAQNAQANLALARLSLRNLDLEAFVEVLGSRAQQDISALITLPRASEGLPLSVQRSQISLGQTAIGVGSAQRDLYPVAQASYSYNLDERSSLNASIESRNLQPSVGYTYQNPARTGAEAAVNSSLSVGVSANISVGIFDEIDAAERQREAAQAGLEAAREAAALESASLESVLGEAERIVALEQTQFGNAQRDFEENQQRQAVGLITPLETQQALVDLLEEDTELSQARFSALQALLDTYTFYALPPSEVLR